MMLKAIIFGGFLFATVFALEKSDIPIAFLEVNPNYDQSLTYRDFRVHFPGVKDASLVDETDLIIKIHKKNAPANTPAFHEYTVVSSKAHEPKTFYFGLQQATEGEYEVEVCKKGSDSECSNKIPALTPLPPAEERYLTCAQNSESSNAHQKPEGSYEKANIIPPSDWMKPDEIEALEAKRPTKWRHHDINSNPSYKSDKKILYAGIYYKVHTLKEVLTLTMASNDDYCRRKYLLSGHLHIMKKDTKEIVHRYKNTIHLSDGILNKYIKNNNEGTPIHVELSFEGVEISPLTNANYQVWLSFCATNKDTNESTLCSDPAIEDLNWE